MPESRFCTACISLTLALVVWMPGCSRRGDPQGDAAARAARPQDAAAAAPGRNLAPDWWEARSELPEQDAGALFQGREPNARLQPRLPQGRPAEPIVAGSAGPPPPSLAYVGKVARDGEGFAVLVRDERVYMVAVGDAVGNGYRVQSISEKEVVILNDDFGLSQTLPFSSGGR